MNELDLNLSATFNGPLGESGWAMMKRILPRGLMLLALTTLSWAALAGAAWLLFLHQ